MVMDYRALMSMVAAGGSDQVDFKHSVAELARLLALNRQSADRERLERGDKAPDGHGWLVGQDGAGRIGAEVASAARDGVIASLP